MANTLGLFYLRSEISITSIVFGKQNRSDVIMTLTLTGKITLVYKYLLSKFRRI